MATNPHGKNGWDKSIISMNSHIKKLIKGKDNPHSILRCGERGEYFTNDQLEVIASFINSFREETCEDEDVEDK